MDSTEDFDKDTDFETVSTYLGASFFLCLIMFICFALLILYHIGNTCSFFCCGKYSSNPDPAAAGDEEKKKKILVYLPLGIMLPVVIVCPIVIVIAFMVLDKNESNRHFSNIIADNINACSDSNISEEAFNADSDLVKSNANSLISKAIVMIILNVLMFVVQFCLIPKEPENYSKTDDQEAAAAEQEV